jgi:hypothetical protein
MNKTATPLLMKSELLQGEELLQSFGANALLPLHPDAGGAGAPPYVLGASALLKVLGMLHLTNYRLKFKPATPSEADFSIFLPAISGVRNVSSWFVWKFRIRMHDETWIDFLRWGVRPVIVAVTAARTHAEELDWKAIGADISAAPDKLGAWSILPPDDQPTTSVASVE